MPNPIIYILFSNLFLNSDLNYIFLVFENREKMVLVMEYAAGGELYDYLSERKVLTEHEARRIFRQIATAVFYCHKHKICHRDLKLENILLDQVGNAKIADFGLSNVFDEQRLLNTFCGSPLYASPEIVKGTPYHGPEVDCWSLGVLLYTLVYGAMPFDGSNFKRLVKQISQSDYFEPKKPSRKYLSCFFPFTFFFFVSRNLLQSTTKIFVYLMQTQLTNYAQIIIIIKDL